MSKRTFISLLLFLPLAFFAGTKLSAQCGAGYTQAQTNWDNLDYYWNSGSNIAPYGHSSGNYITNAWEQNQKFGIGSNYFTIVTSNNAMVNPGAGVSAENATHTGDLAGYAGEDVQYNPSANGQSITITFNNMVTNASFTLYDIDLNQVISVAAVDNLAVPQVVNIATQAGTILTLGGIFPLPRTITANGTALANNLNTGSATISVAGPVKTITITITTVGTDAVFWLSDINACVTGSFPTNYQQTGNNQPMTGPVVNQPDYFIVTPDNQGVYMVDPATGAARWLFTDASNTYVNSFGYDPYNHILYYVTDGHPTSPQNNKALKKYDFNTETISTVVADISTTLGIPTFNQGVESAAASFYDGALYLGIEGGRYGSGGGSVTRETIFWRVEFDAGLNPVNAYQVFSANTYISGVNTSIHDYGDFIIKNGILYDYNTARNGTNYSQSKYHHYNLMTGNLDALYNNPGTTSWNGQSGMTWAGGLYYFRLTTAGSSGIGTYDGAGNNGATVNVTLSGPGPAWPGGAGDGSENFRPKCDFGDAPATYDPNPISPAVHERADTMWLGTTTSEITSWDREFIKRGVNGTADVDNGISTVPFLLPGVSNYLAQVSLYNNSSGNATVMAWLDFNGNGVFDVAEAAQLIPAGPIAPGAAVQTRYLYWPGISTPLLAGASTYLRVRITSTAAGMTSSHATGYFLKGEVEDYIVNVDDYPLTTRLLNFDASLQNKTVKLNWTAAEESGIYAYEIERSADNITWSSIGSVRANGTNGTFDYQSTDPAPLKGISYYRLKIIEAAGMNRYSSVKQISFNGFDINLTVAPNPAKYQTTLFIESTAASEATISVMNIQGKIIFSSTQRINSGTNSIGLALPAATVNGMYIVRLSVGDQVIHKKLVVNK